MGMIETASRIIARFGQDGIFERIEGMGDSPLDPEPGTPVQYAATVAVVSYDQTYQDGAVILSNDLRALVSVDGLETVPIVSDSLIVEGITYRVIRVTPLAPDGIIRFYDLQVRR